MGHRAHFFIVEKGQYEIYYNRWGALTLIHDLFWGPEKAIEYIREQEKGIGCLDEAWIEGGAVVDLDQKVLLLYGRVLYGEEDDISVCIPLRRIYLQLLAKTWSGWDVRWAYMGLVDLVDYVGYPREKVIIPFDENSLENHLDMIDHVWSNLIGSFRLVDGEIRIYSLLGFEENYLLNGPKMIEFYDKTKGFSNLDLQHLEWEKFPCAGFHIDVTKQTLDLWSEEICTDAFSKLQSKWNGWKIEWHQDRYEVQAELTEGKIIFPNIKEEPLISCLRKHLVEESPNPDLVERMTREEIFEQAARDIKC